MNEELIKYHNELEAIITSYEDAFANTKDVGYTSALCLKSIINFINEKNKIIK